MALARNSIVLAWRWADRGLSVLGPGHRNRVPLWRSVQLAYLRKTQVRKQLVPRSDSSSWLVQMQRTAPGTENHRQASANEPGRQVVAGMGACPVPRAQSDALAATRIAGFSQIHGESGLSSNGMCHGSRMGSAIQGWTPRPPSPSLR